MIVIGDCAHAHGAKWHLPQAERACEHEAVWLDEAIFRAGPRGVDDAVAAIRKIQAHAAELRKPTR